MSLTSIIEANFATLLNEEGVDCTCGSESFKALAGGGEITVKNEFFATANDEIQFIALKSDFTDIPGKGESIVSEGYSYRIKDKPMSTPQTPLVRFTCAPGTPTS